MKLSNDVKYGITAMIDLLGFSSHLEIASYDLRTNIGEQAVQRLKTLEDALNFMEKERKEFPEYYPEEIHIQRINDAIFLSMDLDEYLIPEIGAAIRGSVTNEEMKELFSEEELTDYESFKKSYCTRNSNSIQPINKFIGLVSRIYLYINKIESKFFFPGAKAVVSTGFRKQFRRNDGTEDFFSANFSLSNSYIAESKLKGSKLYIDNYIIQLLSVNEYSKNILRCSILVKNNDVFDITKDYDDPFFPSNSFKVTKPIELFLFRKSYWFQELNPIPLSYLQILNKFENFLKNENENKLGGVYGTILNSIRQGVSKEELEKNEFKFSMIYNFIQIIDKSIDEFYELAETGDTKNRKELMSKYLDELSIP